MTSNFYKKITNVTLVMFLMLSLFVSVFSYQPKTAHALSPAVPTDDWISNLKEGSLDAVAWNLANIALSQMSASMVNWINSGFEGSPAFVTDFKGFLTNIADEELGRFIEGSELAFLCSPFQFDIKLSLALKTPFKDRVSCTLSDTVDNLDNFLSGKFSEGGWNGWFEMTTKTQNNPYGAFLLADAEVRSRIKGRQEIELFKLDLGDGFLSSETCTLYDDYGKCLKKEISTPGKVIETQLNNTLAGGQQRLNVADEFDEIVSALLGQLVQKVLFEGLLGSNTGGLSDLDTTKEFNRIKKATTNEVNRIIGTEGTYKTTKEGTLNIAIQEEQQLLILKNCYGTSGDAEIDTTIATLITPLKESLDIDIQYAQIVIDELNLIKTEVLNANELNQLNDLIYKLRDVDTHNVGDAQNQQFTVSTQLSGLNTQQKISACQNDDR